MLSSITTPIYTSFDSLNNSLSTPFYYQQTPTLIISKLAIEAKHTLLKNHTFLYLSSKNTQHLPIMPHTTYHPQKQVSNHWAYL